MMKWKRGAESSIEAALSSVRNDLLDLGPGNPLVNYKDLKHCGIPRLVIGAADAFEHLVLRRDHIVLAPEVRRFSTLEQRSPPAFGLGSDVVDDYEIGGVNEADETVFIPTGLPKAELDRRLLATYYTAQASLREEGVVTLYVVIGIMKWKQNLDDKENHTPLLLVPVELDRSSVGAGFRLRYSGDEITTNLCLVELLNRLGVQLPKLPETSDVRVAEYCEEVREAVAHLRSWYLDAESVSLAQLSFAKVLMYRDLDPANWPGNALLGHPTIATALKGDNFPLSADPAEEKEFAADHLSRVPAHVLEADSSQIQALEHIERGTNLVIQGPPGTGKSQTIVNAIANAVASNKTVLFVSEKMAAVEVVKRRLETIGLGETILEVHSNRTPRKSVCDQIRRTLDMRSVESKTAVSQEAALRATQQRLNEYCAAVNGRSAASGESAYQIYGTLSRLAALFESMPTPQLDLPDAATWTLEQLQSKRQSISNLQAALATSGVPAKSPYWGIPVASMSSVVRERLRQVFASSEQAINELRKSASVLSSALGGPEAATWDEVSRLKEIGLALSAAPPLNGINLGSESWSLQSNQIHATLAYGRELAELTKTWQGKLVAEAWTVDLSRISLVATQLRSQRLRLGSGQPAEFKQFIESMVVGPPPREVPGLLAVFDVIERSQKLDNEIEARGPLMSRIFGPHWRGRSSDWASLQLQVKLIEDIRSKEPNGAMPSWLFSFSSKNLDQRALWELVVAIQHHEAEYLKARDLAKSLLGVRDESEDFDVIRQASGDLPMLQDAYRTLALRIQDLGALTRYLQTRSENLGNLGVELVRIADRWEGASLHLLDLFEYARLTVVLEEIFKTNPLLSSFNADQHYGSVDEFRRLDLLSLQWSRSAIAAAHIDRMRKATIHKSMFDYLVTTSELQNTQPPIRKLITKAAAAVQVVKPVFMMSPNSVASFLPPASIHFDIVIFDEASQMRPAEALGSIARGRQTVVVGDSRQLPPTQFFHSGSTHDKDGEGPLLSDVESILGLFGSRGAQQQILKWHYRSKHESLIALSNQLFYENQLILFPSPDRRRIGVGLVSRYLSVSSFPDGASIEAAKEIEAEEIARAVMNHAADQIKAPHAAKQTLGVATLNARQRDRILEHLEVLRNENPACEDFFIADHHEPFFVKSLENVQGDERDVIYISVGYGVPGGSSVSQALGPVVREGGERRLNVLFTRARQRCEVFTTLKPADVVISDSSPSGIIAFKKFLQYAEHGRISRPIKVDPGPSSSFETQLAERIERLGYTVQRNVGLSGFFLDFAVVDQKVPDRYVLGILCDGPSYSGARSCRDRDRLREEALSSMGWSLCRVWSTAWFQDPQREENKIVAALLQASKLTEPAIASHQPIRAAMN